MSYRTYRGPDGYHSDSDHEDMANTLMEAEAIKKDQKVMGPIKQILQTRKGHIDSIAKLRNLASSGVVDQEYNDGNDPKTKSLAKKIREQGDQEGVP